MKTIILVPSFIILFIILFIGLLLFVALMLRSLAGKYSKKVQKMSCKMGWHSPSHLWEATGFDGASVHCKCPWCGYKGMVDSQGNLF